MDEIQANDPQDLAKCYATAYWRVYKTLCHYFFQNKLFGCIRIWMLDGVFQLPDYRFSGNTDQAWDAVFHHQMKTPEESWIYDAQRSIFDELRGVSAGDETLCRMLDITSQTQWFWKKKLRIQKWGVCQPISKHSLNINFLCIFFISNWFLWESTFKK